MKISLLKVTPRAVSVGPTIPAHQTQSVDKPATSRDREEEKKRTDTNVLREAAGVVFIGKVSLSFALRESSNARLLFYGRHLHL